MTTQETTVPSNPDLGSRSAEAPPHRIVPVTQSDRIVSIDVLRGVAVLGILAMNIYAYAMPFAAYTNPLRWGGDSGIDLGVWFFTHLVFDQKFMTIFSMLFGAGLILMTERAAAVGRKSIAWLYYRRLFWLMLIGMAHGMLLWFGDILYAYAVIGMITYWMRRFSVRTLLITGGLLMVVALPLSTLGSFFQESMVEMKDAALEAQAAGEELTSDQEAALQMWEANRAYMEITPETLAADVAAYRGDYGGIVKHRAPMVFMMWTMMILFFGLWRIGGLMLIGMALMKAGVFSARRSQAFYTRLVWVGYGVGVPLVIGSMIALSSHDWNELYLQRIGVYWNYVGSVLVGLGHIGLVIGACKRLGETPLLLRFSAVGRMAFTNYLMQTVLCTFLFYGHGLGLYGSVDRLGQMAIVVVVWALQLWWSPLWLKTFRYGPAEYIWRSLTYGRLPPLRRDRPVS